MKQSDKISSFTDLHAWKHSHQLVLSIYQISNDFPKTETYGLTDQMRRSAISISSNIAEGFSRKSQKEKVQFYYMAKSSLTESQNQLLVARDVRHIDKESFNQIAQQSVLVSKLTTGLIRSAKK